MEIQCELDDLWIVPKIEIETNKLMYQSSLKIVFGQSLNTKFPYCLLLTNRSCHGLPIKIVTTIQLYRTHAESIPLKND